MGKDWVWVVTVAGAFACQNKGGADGAPPASVVPSVAATLTPSASAPPKADAEGCLAEPEYLVPPQKYGDSDLVRAIAVDGDQAYFRNMTDVFRVPLAGGQPAPHSKGPGLTLSGKAVLWTSGERLLTQSSGEPIFMAAPKSGGGWSNIIDLTAAKLGGGRDAATRILQNLGRAANAPRATQAFFDGASFYWAEISQGKGRNASASSVLKSVPLAGGEAKTLYSSAGEIHEVVKAEDHLAFMLKSPASAEQIKEAEAKRKANKYAFGARGESHLMSVPLAGGEAKKLMRVSHFIAGTVLGVDGKNVYVAGYADEDPSKPGIFRVDASGAAAPEELDRRPISGHVFVSGEQLVFIGSGMLEAGKTVPGHLILTGSRTGKSLTRVACLSRQTTLHASAVANKTALLGLFKTGEGLASIAKIPLP